MPRKPARPVEPLSYKQLRAAERLARGGAAADVAVDLQIRRSVLENWQTWPQFIAAVDEHRRRLRTGENLAHLL